MKTHLVAPLALLALTACGGGDAGVDAPLELSLGTLPGDTSRSGLDFATEASTITDLEGQAFRVLMVRQVTDLATGVPRIVLSEETVRVEDFLDPYTTDGTVTVGAETIRFTELYGTSDAGWNWNIFGHYMGRNARVENVYSYANPDNEQENDPTASGARDVDAVFVYGFETAPEALPAGGTLTYTGDYEGWGNVLDREGRVSDYEVQMLGTLTATADFGANTVQVSLEGADLAGSITAQTEAMPILGNGFDGALTRTSCPATATCTSDSRLTGLFFGPDAGEIAGIILFDETVDRTSIDDFVRVHSAAGFLATTPAAE